MAHEPYVYEYYGEQGVLIPPSTSFLVPFTDQIKDWQTLYCIAAVALEHHDPNLDNRVSLIEYSGVSGYPDMQSLPLGINGNTFVESGVEYNNKFALGLKNDEKYVDTADDSIIFMGISNPYISNTISELYYFQNESVNLNLFTDTLTGIGLGFERDFINNYQNLTFDNLNNRFLNFGEPDKMVNGLNEHLCFVGLRFQIFNPNSTTQSLQISLQEMTGQTLTNKSNFKSFVDNFSPQVISSTFNYTFFNTAALPIPNNFYIKWPFTRSRLRLHAFYINATDKIV